MVATLLWYRMHLADNGVSRLTMDTQLLSAPTVGVGFIEVAFPFNLIITMTQTKLNPKFRQRAIRLICINYIINIQHSITIYIN